MSHSHEMTPAEVQKHVSTYIKVFASLLVLTCLTVAVFYWQLPIAGAIIVALIVASVKGSLVAAFFMHLKSERGMIFSILLLCALFFLVLLLIPVLTVADNVGVRV